jgi:hypothetical protein
MKRKSSCHIPHSTLYRPSKYRRLNHREVYIALDAWFCF